MTSQSFIFIGRSGCGKGTQAELLKKVLNEKDPARNVLHIETGKELRDFINGPTLTQKRSKEIYDTGGLQPEFLAVHMWVRLLAERYTGGEHLIFDGTPRKLHEAGVLNSIFDFYGFDKPWVINIEISSEESFKRLFARKRMDDNEEDIKERLSWYETDVVPALSYYDGNPRYNFLKIFGEKPVEAVHEDIVKKLGLS